MEMDMKQNGSSSQMLLCIDRGVYYISAMWKLILLPRDMSQKA